MESGLPLSETYCPSSTEEAVRMVRDAAESKTGVYPLGGGTALDYGGSPTREGIGLSLAKLNRLVDYPARDLTITVEAGMTVAEMNRLTAEKGQRIPVDIPQASEATIGGAVAVAMAGPRRFSCGTLRDYVLGLEVIDGAGNHFSTGGRVVKNAAGYDLSRLFTGSLGALGVITQVTLMAKPIPEIWGFHACRAAQPERILDCLAKTRAVPCAIELLRGPQWDDLPGFETNSTLPMVVVGFEGPEAEVGWMLDTLEAEWAEVGVGEKDGVNILGEDADGLWERLREFSVVPEKTEQSVVVEMGVLPHHVAELAERIIAADKTCSLQAHAGSGVIRMKQTASDESEVRRIVQEIRKTASDFQGRATVLSVPGGVRLTAEEAWGPLGTGLSVMKTLKQRFDPQGILNPGRTVY